MGLFGWFSKKKKPTGMGFVERRLVPRWQLKVPIRITCTGFPGYAECWLEDLNYKGLAFSSPQPLPEGCTELTVLVNEHLFHLEVAVAWHKEKDGRHAYGVKFTRLRESDKERIYKMMKEEFPHIWKT